MRREKSVFKRRSATRRGWSIAVLALLLVCLMPEVAARLQAESNNPWGMLSLQVNSTGDLPDTSPGDGTCLTLNGQCTLRAALEEVMVTAGTHTINITVTGTIQLTGQLPVITNSNGLNNLTINGPSANNLTINRHSGGTYRILNIIPQFNGELDVTVSGVTISNGSSAVSGGGIYTFYSKLVLDGVAFRSNSAPDGSALYTQNTNLTITNCSFSSGSGSGAAIGFDSGAFNNFTLSNSTVTDNQSAGLRIKLDAGAAPTIVSSTIVGNGGNGIELEGTGGRTLQLRSNIIAGNTGSSVRLSGSNNFGSLGHNLVGDNGGGYFTGTGDLISTDPQLAPLGDYGGPTPTRALLRGSPAIDAGTATGTPATDQRGVARSGLTDIGAFESRGFQLAIASGNNQVTIIGTSFPSPLAVTISSVDSGVPISGAPVTFTPPVAGASAVIGGNPAAVSGTGAVTGTVTANLSEGSYTVTATTTGVAAPVSFSLRNGVAPTVTSIVRVGNNPTTASSLGFTVTFSEAVTGLTAANFSLALTSAPAATITGVSGSGTTWSVSITTGGGTGRIGLDLVNAAGIVDADGLAPANLPFSGEVWTLAPRVISINRNGPSQTTAGNVSFDITFSENVTGVSPTAFQLVTAGLSGATISSLSGSGATRAVTVSTGSGSGTIGLNLVSTVGVVDSDGATLGNLPFVGEIFSIAPTVISITRAGADPTGASTLNFTVTFSSDLTGGSTGNFALVTSGSATATVSGVAGAGATRTVTVSAGSGSGTIGLNLIDTTGLGGFGGLGLANLPFVGESYTVDRTPPETTISSGPLGLVVTTGATLVFTASDAAAIAGYECRLDGATFGPCTSPVALVGLAAGPHSFEVRSIDAFGNIDPSPARQDWIINSPPTISSTGTIELVAGAGPEVRTIGQVSDPDQSATSLGVALTALSGAGVTIAGIVIDGAGAIRAEARAVCGAVPSIFRLTVTDLVGEAATVIITVNISHASRISAVDSQLSVKTVTALCPVSGSEPSAPLVAGLSIQNPGSILFYNLYSSKAANNFEDTRIVLTNTNQSDLAAVHLFFVDGLTGWAADCQLILTPSQTVSLLASEVDPGTTGFLIAVAINSDGCPAAFNHLIGESLVRFASGHSAALAAQAAVVLDTELIDCHSGTASTELRFDGRSCSRLPRLLAVNSLAARSAGNETLLIVNRLGGSLIEGTAGIGEIVGFLFDDQERGASFTLASSATQMRGQLGQNFPRTVPRYEALIPTGRTGWMKFSAKSDVALSGAIINLGRDRFDQGHNLHQLSATGSATITVPVAAL